MRVAIRSEINPSVAAGHLTRCVAIAKALQSIGVHVTIHCDRSEYAYQLCDLAQIHYQPVADGALPVEIEDARALATGKPSIVLADSPKLTQQWIDSVRGSAIPVIYISGAPCTSYLNADGCIWPEICPAELPSSMRFACGFEYLLLSDDYLHRRKRSRSGSVQRVLLTTGGADHFDLCADSVSVLDKAISTQLEIRLILGAFFQRPETALRAAKSSRHTVTCIKAPCGLADHLEWADIAISGGGGTLYEMACCGVPGVGIAIWPQQETTVDSMASAGSILPIHYKNRGVLQKQLGDSIQHLLENEQVRTAQAEIGPRLVDGRGSQRVAEWLINEWGTNG